MAETPAPPAAETESRRRGAGRFVMFITVVLLIFAVAHAYVGARVVGGLAHSALATIVGWTLVWLLFASIPLGLIVFRSGQGVLGKTVFWVSHVWFGAFGLVLTAVVATDVVRLFALGVLNREVAFGMHWPALQAWAIVALVIPSALWGMRTALGPVRIERVTVPITGLPSAFAGYRIAQISDVHIGTTLRHTFLERVVAQVNGLKPDAVAVTGDLVDASVGEIRDEVAPLSKLSGRDGVYYVTGNHEYYHGGPAWEAEVKRLGLTVLHNEHRLIHRDGHTLVMAGVTDLQGGGFHPSHACRPDLALENAPKDAPTVLLAHQPKAAELLEGLKVDLQLSGHTHGGQIFPFMFFVRLQQPVVSGLKKLFGIWVYTSRGTGFWGPPLRVGPAPEITEITLVPA